MTPERYLKLLDRQTQIITQARKIIKDALDAARQADPPSNIRSATLADIKIRAIIWYCDGQNEPSHWHIVEEILRPSNTFKAYVAEDGCRYGLDGAFVRSNIEGPSALHSFQRSQY